MRVIILALLLSACSAPLEGQRFGPFEGMMWPVECRPDMLHELAERWEYESPNYCDAENLNAGEINGYGMCAEWMRVRYRYEWAKTEYRKRCEREV